MKSGLLLFVFLFLSPLHGVHGADTQIHFDGKDLSHWRGPSGTWEIAAAVSLDPKHPESFLVKLGQGVTVNNPKGPTVNLISLPEFGDVDLHVEFCIPKHSN